MLSFSHPSQSVIKILRLGHRAGRDDRISTHVGLTARQWGADEVVYSGERDSSMMNSLDDTVERWGGNLDISYEKDFESIIEDFDGLKIHLTMYGEKINEKEPELKQELDEDTLIIVGAEKVPRSVYRKADHNISVGNQPHSEIAALAVFMDRFFEIKEDFEDAEIRVNPSKDQKLTETE